MTNFSRALRVVSLLTLVIAISGCKIVIEVPEGGIVTTESGAFECRQNRVCVVEVDDTFFDEVFEARPHRGWEFRGWAKRQRGFCGDKLGFCALATTAFAGNERLLALLASDQEFYLQPVFEQVPMIAREDVLVNGTSTETPTGLQVDGRVEVNAGFATDHTFRNAELELDFDVDGNLIGMSGISVLPPELTDLISASSDSRVVVGLFTGREINRDGGFEITLLDSRMYYVFLSETATDLELSDGSGSGPTLTIGTPLSGKVVLIVDPADQMLYRYGDVSGTAVGAADSRQSLIPFEPVISGSRVDRFNGNIYDTGKFGIDGKFFSTLVLDGEMVTRAPIGRLTAANPFAVPDFLTDPFGTEARFRSGFNGQVNLAFGAKGFSVLDFDMASASASFDIGLKRQAISIYTVFGERLRLFPDWIPLRTVTTVRADFTLDPAVGVYSSMSGQFGLLQPPANLEGEVRISSDEGMSMFAAINGDSTQSVRLTFADEVVDAEVDLGVTLNPGIQESVLRTFDEEAQVWLDRQDDLSEAVGDYELELSLRGFREAIPAVVSGAKSAMSRVPQQVRDTVYSRVRSEINDRRACFILCVPSNGERDRIATREADNAKRIAQAEIDRVSGLLDILQREASKDDDESVRNALRAALQEIYNNRVVSGTVTVNVNVAGFTVSRSVDYSQTILTSAQQRQVLAAIDAVDRLPAVSDRVISAQAIIDNIPTKAALDAARDRVVQGTDQIPEVRGVTFTIDRGRYKGGILLSTGERLEVDFNVLDIEEVIVGVSELVGDTLVDSLAP